MKTLLAWMPSLTLTVGLRRAFLVAAGLVTLLGTSGCTICSSCEDEFYPNYGGAWQRTQRTHGRVGSILDPAGYPVGAVPAAENPASKTPATATDDLDIQPGGAKASEELNESTRGATESILESETPASVDPANSPGTGTNSGSGTRGTLSI